MHFNLDSFSMSLSENRIIKIPSFLYRNWRAFESKPKTEIQRSFINRVGCIKWRFEFNSFAMTVINICTDIDLMKNQCQ